MKFSEALELLRKGKKVSSKRWGESGEVYVEVLNFEFRNEVGVLTHSFQTLILEDTKRNKKVSFTPSVENMFDDEWYEVERKEI